MDAVASCTLLDQALTGPRPEGWAPLRAEAETRLQGRDLPTSRQEDWKYLDLSELRAFEPKAGGLATVDIKDAILPEARGNRLVFVNGRYEAHHSCISGLPAGVRFMPLRKAEDAAAKLGQIARAFEGDAFLDLNTARFEDGALLFVPRNVKVEAPLHLLSITQGDGLLAQPRLLLILERGAEARLVEDHQGSGRSFVNAVVEVHLAEGAILHHERVQREDAAAFHVSNLYAQVGRDAQYQSRTLTFGAKLSRQNPHIHLEQGATATLDGLALLGADQVADTHSFMHHAKPHGTSRQLHKCIVDGTARAIFNGRVLVDKHAQVTDGQQQVRTLLLSDTARVDAKPQLEIHADDVKCSHGAAIGQLDPEELFYLRSRGMNEELARNLLTYGFAADLLAHVPVTSLRRALRQLVLARTHGEGLGELG
ncbi:MAG TPA: Fe-S cluster assembly protein SufD [Holophagaceae bacterium]|nr:Fe-S cluster assembly protein SufD [Holophagaceae bacterium]